MITPLVVSSVVVSTIIFIKARWISLKRRVACTGWAHSRPTPLGRSCPRQGRPSCTSGRTWQWRTLHGYRQTWKMNIQMNGHISVIVTSYLYYVVCIQGIYCYILSQNTFFSLDLLRLLLCITLRQTDSKSPWH